MTLHSREIRARISPTRRLRLATRCDADEGERTRGVGHGDKSRLPAEDQRGGRLLAALQSHRVHHDAPKPGDFEHALAEHALANKDARFGERE